MTMKTALILATAIVSFAAETRPGEPAAPDVTRSAAPHEGRVPVGGAELYTREIGQGPPAIVLHGGPDFDHGYLLPEMDRLADLFRLVYYDQRGRGRSAEGVRPEDVTLESEIRDLDAVRQRFGIDAATILGHSWGAVLALEYAIRHPERVTRLILMNPAPASRDDFLFYKKERGERSASTMEQLGAMRATAGYKEGDPDAVAAYYRIHFKEALERQEDLEKVLASLRASFTKEGILKARAVEQRLMDETWLSDGYDLLPRLGKLGIPTLVLTGDHDLIPVACAEHIARAIPKASLVTLKECGHFSYLECPDQVRAAIENFLHGTERRP
jgi:proline iminopeptidase